MKSVLFNVLFDDLVDSFCVEIDQLAVSIDRHPSRIRHWKKDALPSKYILSDLVNAIMIQVEKHNSTNEESKFKQRWINRLKDESLFNENELNEISTHANFKEFINHLLKKAYYISAQSTTQSVQPALEMAKSFETSGQFKEAEKIYLKLLSPKGPSIDIHNRSKIYAALGFINFMFVHTYGDSSYYSTSIDYFVKCMKGFDHKNHPDEYAIILKQLGTVYNSYSEVDNSSENLENALKYYYLALEYINRTDNSLERLKILHNIEIAYLHYSKVADSLENVDKSLSIFETIFKNDLSSEPAFKALCEMNMGLAYSYKIDIRFSLDCSQRAIQLSNKALCYFTIERNPHYFAIINTTIGATYLALSQIKEASINAQFAIDSLTKVLWIYDANTNARLYYQTHYNIATAYLVLFGETESVHYLNDAKQSIEILIENDTFEKFGLLSLTMKLLLGQYASAQYKLGLISDPELIFKHFDEMIHTEKSREYVYYVGIGIIEKCNALLSVYSKTFDQKYLIRILNYRSQILSLFTAIKYPIYYAIANRIMGDTYIELHKYDTNYDNLSEAKKHYQKALSIYTEAEYSEKHSIIKAKLESVL